MPISVADGLALARRPTIAAHEPVGERSGWAPACRAPELPALPQNPITVNTMMKVFGILAALTIALCGGSVATAQHGNHHNSGGNNGSGSGSGQSMMSCCNGTADMCDPATCPGHIEKKDGKCDMSKCCGKMMGQMGDASGDQHSGGTCDMGNMGGMGGMMGDHHGQGNGNGAMGCGSGMGCCRTKTKNPEAASGQNGAPKPTLK